MIGYIIVGVICFVLGFLFAAINTNKINIGFKQTITINDKDDEQ